MKKISIFIILLISIKAVNAQQGDTIRYTARHIYNLSGPVACVTTSRATILRFDREGELIDEEGERVLDYKDDFYHPFVILYPDPYTRYETNQITEDAGRVDRYYTFDHHGRLQKIEKTAYIRFFQSNYKYPNHNARFPHRIEIKDGNDGGTLFTIIDYTYLEFDHYGNWTKRKVTENNNYQEYYTDDQSPPPFTDHRTSSYEETAEYIYY